MENNSIPTEQLCVISIMFPVSSDDQAIDYKKKLAEVLLPIPDVRIEFRLTNANVKPPTVH